MIKRNMNGSTIGLLLDETIRAREELLENMQTQSNRLFTLLNISILLLGIFITSAFFIHNIHNNEKWVIITIIIISIGLLIFSLFLGLIGLIPRFFEIAMLPNRIYELKIEKKDKAVDKFLQTYLWEQKKLLLKYGERPFLVKIIIFTIITSIGEYSLAWFSFVFNFNSNVIYFISAIMIIIFLIYSICSYRNYYIMQNILKLKLEE